MKFLSSLAITLAGASIASTLSLPHEVTDLTVRGDAFPSLEAAAQSWNELFKRKGGGGKGGSSGGSSSGGSRSSGSGSSSSSGSGSRGVTSSSSSSVRPSFGGGRFYGGGSTKAFSAGSRSPGGIRPGFIAAPLLLFPGIGLAGAWAYGAYRYRHSDDYTFLNKTLSPPRNQTKPVECLCARYQACGCDDNNDTAYLDDLIGNGSYAALNKSLVNVADDDGRSTIIINGTLANGTSTGGSMAAHPAVGWTGYGVMAAAVAVAMFGL